MLAPAALAIAAGALAACGFRPLMLWPLTLAGLAVLLALVARSRGPWSAALAGCLWGIGHFCVGDNWIATAFTYQANMPAWLGWIAVFLLSLYLALFPAIAADPVAGDEAPAPKRRGRKPKAAAVVSDEG